MGRKSTYRFPFASLPALRVAILLITGILIGYTTGSGLSVFVVAALFTAIFCIWLILEFRNARSVRSGSIVTKNILYLKMVILFGAGLAIIDRTGENQVRAQTGPLALYEWEKVRIKGKVREWGKNSSGREIYGIDADETIFEGRYSWHQPYQLRVYGNEQTRIPDSHVYFEAVIRLYEFPEKRNPHEFDYGGWLRDQSYAGHGELKRVIKSEPGSGFKWQSLRTKVFDNVESLFGQEQIPLAKALLTGHKDELTAEERASFSRSGLSHIMAVSGMHVGFVVAPFWFIIPWLWRRRWGKIAGLFVLTALLIGYAGLTGFSASVSRASIMAWLLTYGKLFHKIRHSVNLLACAALILLIVSPSQLFDVGFQLSFSAVLIILLLMPEAQGVIPERIRYTRRGGLISVMMISLIVQAGLFPILTAYFGEFSIIGPLANALVVPLLSLVVPVGLLISILGGFLQAPSEWLAGPVGVALSWISYVAEQLGGNDLSYIVFNETTFWVFPVWVCGIAVIASARIRWLRWKMAALFLLSLNMMMMDEIFSGREQSHLTVTLLDVGQGDAIHVETPAGKHFMIDAGRWSPGGNSGENVILPYLQSKGINRLDALLISHPHADHIGGLPTVLKSIQTDVIYQSDYPYDSNLYREYLKVARSRNVPVQNAAAGDMIAIDPAIRLFVVGPGSAAYDSNANNHSLAFRMDYGETSFLFTGDAEERQESEMIQKYGDFLDVNFLKIGHHGSKTSSTDNFIKAVNPDVAAASLGFHNRFKHPNREVVTHLHRTGAKKYFTSLSGALIFRSNGHKISSISE